MPAKQLTIRARLTYLVLACVLPVWLIAALLVRHQYDAKVAEINRDMLDIARSTALLVDRELSNVQGALLGLATSPSFAKHDYADMHRQTKELLKAYPGANIIVAEASGQQVVNSTKAFGESLPKRGNPEIVQQIFQTGKPAISNLFLGAVSKRPLIAVDVPVYLDGKVAYDLSMTFSSSRMAEILPQGKLLGGYCSIMDRNGVRVATTRQPEMDYVGKQAAPELLKAISQAPEGITYLKKGTGSVPTLAAFSRSATSGWSVAFGVPLVVARADLYSWMAWAVGGATVISLFGIIVAMGIARRIADDIHSLVEPALAIGRGEMVPETGEKISKETAEVAQALVQASEILQRRARERDRAEAALSKSLEELQRETAERLKALDELRKNEQLLIQQSRQAAMGEMIGNIAHQWRQPLNALGLLAQETPLLYEYGEVDGEFLRNQCNKSMELINHMSSTIEDFRNFFKPDKEKVSFSVRGEVERTLSLIGGSMQREIALEVEVLDDPVIEGYPNEYAQVLLNIVINARDAIADNGIQNPTVRIRVGSEGGKSVVTITDNAGGIAEGIIGKIFDPYFTTKGPQAGTGVGLFMSKTIIEKNMGGVLTARNVEGGAEFRIVV